MSTYRRADNRSVLDPLPVRTGHLASHQWSLSYRDGEHKTLVLEAPELIRRFLLHVLPKGLMRVRHYGLQANRCGVQRLAQIRKILAAPTARAQARG